MNYEAEHDKWTPIGARLLEIRGTASQAEMAKRLAVSKSTYNRLERGIRELGADVLSCLEGLGWNPRWIVSGRGPARCGGSSPPVGDRSHLEPDQLAIAIELADDVLKGQWLPTGRYAHLVATLYEATQQATEWSDMHTIAEATLADLRADAPPQASSTGS